MKRKEGDPPVSLALATKATCDANANQNKDGQNFS